MFSIGHLFLVEGKWWTSAIEIEVGDKLVLSNGEVTDVLDVSVKEGSYPIKTYNLSVDENHTFFVDSQGVLTHNTANIRKCKASKGVSEAKYQVGAYKDIKGVEGLDAHHAGQKAAMKKLVDGYDELTAPAINVPRIGHTKRHPVRGIVSRSTKGITNARQLLARDIMELRRVYPDIPNSKLQELIEMNKKLYPEMRK